MSTFDPYHKWLGIPPDEQPPTYYRLLGVKAVESDPDVIQHAVDQRMVHLRSMQAGKAAELSQKLLNEVAAVGACLLNAERKRAYDAKLRGKQAVKEPAMARSAPLPPASPRPAPRNAETVVAPPVRIESCCLHCNTPIDYSDPDTFTQCRCQKCGAQIPAPPPGVGLAPAASNDDEILEALGVKDISVTEVVDDTILCKFCSEPIKRTARKCKHCGEFLDAKPFARHVAPTVSVPRQSYAGMAQSALTVSILGLFCFGPILGSLAIFMGSMALRGMSNSGNSEGYTSASAAVVIGIVDFIFGTIMFFVILGGV